MAIKIKNLSYRYPNGKVGLNKIHCHLSKGKKTAILGLNGSGKTTLLNHLCGSLLPQEGSVDILGLSLEKKNLREIRKRVGFLFDYPDHQLFSTTVYADLKFGLDNYGYPEEKKEELIQKVSQRFGLEEMLSHSPHQLSLGQKKKVATAGVMIMEPELILCDEPFSGLDGLGLSYFKELLDYWVKEEEKTLVFSTHDVDLSYAWADEVILLKEGELLYQGKVEEVLQDEKVYEEVELEKPFLLRLFQGRKEKPRTIEEAKRCMEDIGA